MMLLGYVLSKLNISERELINQLQTSEPLQFALKSHPVLAIFTSALNCPSCDQFINQLHAPALDFMSIVPFMQVNCDLKPFQKLCLTNNIQSYPTYIILFNSENESYIFNISEDNSQNIVNFIDAKMRNPNILISNCFQIPKSKEVNIITLSNFKRLNQMLGMYTRMGSLKIRTIEISQIDETCIMIGLEDQDIVAIQENKVISTYNGNAEWKGVREWVDGLNLRQDEL